MQIKQTAYFQFPYKAENSNTLAMDPASKKKGEGRFQ